MNIRLCRRVSELELEPKAKYLLYVLAMFADRVSCVAWPSVSTLAKWTGYGTTAVRGQLKKLREAGHIHPQGNTKGGKGQTTRYRVLAPTERVDSISASVPNMRAVGMKDSIPNGLGLDTQHPSVDEGIEGGYVPPSLQVARRLRELRKSRKWQRK